MKSIEYFVPIWFCQMIVKMVEVIEMVEMIEVVSDNLNEVKKLIDCEEI